MTTLAEKPFALLGIHIGGSTVPQLKETMEKQNLPWRSFVDLGNAGTGPIATSWNLSATPTFYLLDHHGLIRYKWAGAPGEKALDEAIDKLIRELELEKQAQ